MAHIDEHTLELIVTEPERYPASDQAVLMEHLSACPGCRAVYDEILLLHRALRDHPGVPAGMLASAMHRIFAAGSVVRLTPYHPHLQVPAGGAYSGILAAMAPETVSSEGFETVATFASEVDHILLRVRQDAGRRRVRLYYHTDDPERRRGPVVTLPALAADAVIDDRGRSEFRIDTPRSPREWSRLEALVAFPAFSLQRLADGTVVMDQNEKRGYEVSLAQHDGKIEIRCTHASDVPAIRRAVVWTPDGASVLVEIPADGAVLTDPSPGNTLMIRLYT